MVSQKKSKSWDLLNEIDILGLRNLNTKKHELGFCSLTLKICKNKDSWDKYFWNHAQFKIFSITINILSIKMLAR